MSLRTPEQIKADPVWQAFNPRDKRFIEARMLPASLNPFAGDGIDVVAFVIVGLPHAKAVPAHVMLWQDYVNELYQGVHTLVVPSSGNTVHAVARLAPVYGLKVKAVMNLDVPDSKTGILRQLGNVVDVLQVRSVEETTAEESAKPGHYHLDQYGHEGNPESHRDYTGPLILRVLNEAPAVVAAALGSGGTAFGLAQSFKEMGLDTRVVGVRPILGEQVPGARDEKKMADVVKLPWQSLVKHVAEVGRKESFIGMRQLWSAVEPQPGPTSGMAWRGLMRYLESVGREGRQQYRGRYVGFFCPDDGRFYTAPTLSELDADQGIIP
jgi:cysteine synthase